MVNEHITSLGYRLEFADDPAVVAPLLKACNIDAIDEIENSGWERSQYLLACTRAGGTAATVGWSRIDDMMVLHSLAVAPTSRGSGIGASLLASALGYLMDKRPVEQIFLTTSSGSARRIFASMGFQVSDAEDVPDATAKHPSFASPADGALVMVRNYKTPPRGLDNYAFRLILNETEDATLPLGSVFFFRQTGNVIEGQYRGGPVVRGHLMGAISDDDISFCWHQFIDEGRLMSGDGNITLEPLPDGRRELREEFQGSGTLLLREV